MKNFNLKTIISELKSLQDSGKKIVFTNGVFDILHRGHVTYLKEAKKLGDFLLVGINDDDSVRRLNKGPDRPINPEDARAFIISELKSVDYAFLFSEDTPLRAINEIMPDILVKGGDYNPDCTDSKNKSYIVGSKEVIANGGQVVSIDLVKGYSTTNTINKINQSKA